MLVPILLLVTIIALLTGAILDIGVISARIALAQKASIYTDIALDRSIHNYLEFVRERVQSQGSAVITDPVAFAPPKALVAPVTWSACGQQTNITTAPCPFHYQIAVRLTGTTYEPITPYTAQISGSANAISQSFVNEQKAAAVLTVTLLNTNGLLVATRSRLLTFRVFENQPFVSLTGVRDITSRVGNPNSGEGDSAGHLPPSEDPSDTTVKVDLDCQQTARPRGSVYLGANTSPEANEHLPWGNSGGHGFEVSCNDPTADASFYDQSRKWVTGTENSGWVR